MLRTNRLALAVFIISVVGCSRSGTDTSPSDPSDSSAGSKADSTETIDVLPGIDSRRDQVQGEFLVVDDSLFVPDAQPSQLELPLDVPGAYRLEFEAERIAGNGSLNVGLLVNHRPVMLVLEGWQASRLSGLSLVDGKPAPKNATAYREPIFAKGERTRVVCTVDVDRVEVACDGRTIVDWQGDASRLSVNRQFWKVRDPQRLRIGSWGALVRITNLTVTARSGAAGISAPPTEPDSPSRPASVLFGDDWPVFDGSKWGFTVKMPRNPAIEEGEDGMLQFTVPTNSGAYTVSVSTRDTSMSAEETLRQAISTFSEEVADIFLERDAEIADADATSEVAAVDSEGDLYVARHVVVGERFYQAIFVGPPSQFTAPETRRFLDSFTVSER
jgi:hypothetical protein